MAMNYAIKAGGLGDGGRNFGSRMRHQSSMSEVSRSAPACWNLWTMRRFPPGFITAGESSELAKIMLDSPLPTLNQFSRGAINAAGTAGMMLAIHSASDEARLVVGTQSTKLWVDG
jgi:hypothetical protein